MNNFKRGEQRKPHPRRVAFKIKQEMKINIEMGVQNNKRAQEIMGKTSRKLRQTHNHNTFPPMSGINCAACLAHPHFGNATNYVAKSPKKL